MLHSPECLNCSLFPENWHLAAHYEPLMGIGQRVAYDIPASSCRAQRPFPVLLYTAPNLLDVRV